MSGVTSLSLTCSSFSLQYDDVRIGESEGIKLSASLQRSMLRLVSLGLAVETISCKAAEATSAACQTVTGAGSAVHRRRKRGARGRLAPPSFKLGGHRPPNFTHCLHNKLHCSVVDRIACRHCSSRKSHFCCLKKMLPPQVRTSSYAYGAVVVRTGLRRRC